MKVLDILDLHDFLTAKERTRSADYYFGKNSIIVSYYKITECLYRTRLQQKIYQ